MLIYIAGKYRGDVEANICAAKMKAVECYLKGHDVICPHMNTAHMDKETGLPDEFWLKTTMNLLRRCDAIVLVPGWEESQGTLAEIEYAKLTGIPVYEDVPELHVSEKERPKQVAAFIEVLMIMYRVHLSKNADYSAANILGTG
jgi:nucleoside 2-deoxyribosyltransferase